MFGRVRICGSAFRTLEARSEQDERTKSKLMQAHKLVKRPVLIEKSISLLMMLLLQVKPLFALSRNTTIAIVIATSPAAARTLTDMESGLRSPRRVYVGRFAPMMTYVIDVASSPRMSTTMGMRTQMFGRTEIGCFNREAR